MSRRKRKPVKRLIIQSDSSEEDDDDDDFVPVTKKFIKSEKLSTNEKRLKSPIKKDTDSSSLITDKKEPNPPLPEKQQKLLVTIPPNKDSKTNQNKPLPQPKPYWKPPGQHITIATMRNYSN
uniref:Uncharacterized protein n=1 Tax=Amphimedon queenslandica TaxID=400682 RepID=A0A1X7UE69_AMPQE